MAEDITPNTGAFTSEPIVPSLPEFEASTDATALLTTPPPIISPVLPSGTPDSALINTQLQGNYSSGPNPGLRPDSVVDNGTMDYAKALTGYINDDNVLNDRYKYGRAYAYGSGYKNLNFDRYYKHPKFKELGFSPYSDNDTYYNERSSWWDDFSRMRGEFMPLAWSGFKSVWGSEQDANEEMERRMAVGTSSKEGAGAWVTNFGLNAAYTVGIMGELAAENAVLAGIEAASFGTATPAVGAAMYARNSMGIGKLAKAITGTADFIKSLKTAGAAKNFFTAAKVGEKATDFAKWVNPFERTLEWSTHLAKGTGGVKDLSNMAKVSKTFGNFYRDLRELNVAHSEARLEGEGASTEYQNQLIDEFYAANGRMPEGQEARDIYDRAQSVKSAVTLANDATIYLTNKIVFEDLLDGVVPGKALAKSFMEGSGRFFERTAAKEFKAADVAAKTEGTAAYKAAEATTGQKAKDFLLKSEYVPWSKTYFLGNLGEALQENAQEVITQSAMDYYDKIHKNPAQAGFYEAMLSVGKATTGQFSGKGLDTFLQGYLMGSLIQGGGKGLKTVGRKIFDKAGLEAEKARAEETENEKYNAVNFILDNALIYGGNKADVASSIAAVKQAKDKAAGDGDKMAARSMENEMQVNYFDSLARTNSMNLVTDHVDDLLSLEDKDLENAFNNKESAEKIRSKLSTLKERANDYQQDYDRVKRIKPNPYNPWMYSGRNKDGSLKYPDIYNAEMNRYMAHEKAVSDILFSKAMHGDIANRMESMLNVLAGSGALKNFYNKKTGADPIGSDLTVLVDPVQRAGKLQELKSMVEVMEQGTPQQKKEAKTLRKELEMLEEWNVFSDTFKRELRQKGKIGKSGRTEGVEFALNNLYKTYKKYIKHKAGINNGYVFEDQLNEAFNYIKDFADLSVDEQLAVNTINTLSDPDMFNRYVDIQTNIQRMQREQAANKKVEALNEFKKMAQKNEMLKEIFGLGLFVLPEDVDKIKAYDVTNFYDVTTKALVDKSDPKYAQAKDIIRKYGRAAGVDYVDEIVKPDAHVVKGNADGTFSVISPQGNLVGTPLKTKAEAETIAKDLDQALKEEEIKKAAAAAATTTTTTPPAATTTTTKPAATVPPPASKAKAEPTVTFKAGDKIETPFGTYTVEREIPNKNSFIVQVKLADGKVEKRNLPYSDLLAIHNEFKEYKPVTEEKDVEEKDLMEEYAEISNLDDLNAWNRRVLMIVASDAEVEAVNKKYGIDLRKDAMRLKKAAIRALVENSKKIENLQPGLIVFLSNRTAQVVLKNDGKTVSLVSASDYKNLLKPGELFPSQEAIDSYDGPVKEVAEENLKTEIKMVQGQYEEVAEEVKGLTEEEIKQSDEGLAAAKADPKAEQNEDVEAGLKTNLTDAMKNMFDAINKCNNPK